MSQYCGRCGERHDSTSHTCNPVNLANPELMRGSWKCGSCGVNYPPWVEKCDCSKVMASLEFRGVVS